ncbi:O-methyltransferase-domain-containing protein [Phaeosphaeria sp. MPI-PUGE-AT-0046c]|nr:O-methyltransferase-domain-containing protein [Phaeosphaeria sp. MPI-PUGE-AT-0046c]
MTSNRRLVQLSTLVQENTAAVDAYVEKAGLPEPSFEPSAPLAWDLPPDIDTSRNAALEALDELREHLLGPTQNIVSRVVDMGSLVSLHALVKFNIASHLPVSSSISVPDLADACNMHVEDLDIIVRHGITRRLFLLQIDGKITHSALSKALVDVPSLRTFVAGVSGNLWTALPRIVEVMEKWPGSQEMEESAYKLTYGKTFWEDFEAHPQKGEDFAGAMTFFLQNPALDIGFVHAYDWAQHANGTVVDLGGSKGEVAFTLAQRYPDMKLVVQDRAEIVALAPEEKPENVEFQAHDFFEPQLLHGADVYFFRWIMHDWSAKYCVKILRALVPALKHKARIVLMETILPEPGVLSLYQERMIRSFDVVMKATYNAKERTETDWRVIIADADDKGRFNVVDVLRPAGSQLGFLVIEWTG